MQHEIHFGPDWAEIRTSGVASVAGIQAFGEALAADPRWRPGMDLIVNHTDLDVRPLGPEEMATLGRRARRKEHPTRGFRRCTFVLPGKLQYGVGRMWQSFAEHSEPGKIQLFESLDAAHAWLRASVADDSTRAAPR